MCSQKVWEEEAHKSLQPWGCAPRAGGPSTSRHRAGRSRSGQGKGALCTRCLPLMTGNDGHALPRGTLPTGPSGDGPPRTVRLGIHLEPKPHTKHHWGPACSDRNHSPVGPLIRLLRSGEGKAHGIFAIPCSPAGMVPWQQQPSHLLRGCRCGCRGRRRETKIARAGPVHRKPVANVFSSFSVSATVSQKGPQGDPG